MSSDPAPRRRSLGIYAVAIAALLAGLGVLVSQWHPAFGPRVTLPPVAPSDTGDAVIGQALGQIPTTIDSSAIKSQWRDDIKGIDVSALDAKRLETFVRFANAERCTCGCGYTLAACRTYDQTCPVSGPILEALRDSVAKGLIHVVRGLRERPATPS